MPPDSTFNENAAAAPAGRMATLTRSFKHRNFRLFFSGQFVSLIGTWMQNVAEAWLVYRLTGSSAALGLVRFAGLAPVFLFALIGGDWADRGSRRAILVGTQSSAMILAFTLAALCLTNTVQVWHVVVLATLLGLVSAMDVPTRQSFIVEMVGKEDLANAIGLNSSMFHLARVIGPSVAGALLAAVGEGWCFTINGVSFLAVIASLLLMRLPARAPETKARAPMAKRIKEGLNYAWNNHDMRNVLGLIAMGSFFGSSYMVLMPVFAQNVLHSGAKGFGILMAAAGAGSLAGALTLSMRRDVTGLWKVRFIASVGFGISLLLFALSHSFWLSAALLLPVGFAMILFMAVSNTLLQTICPDALRGRVMALYSMMFMGMAPFGALLAGLMAEFLGAGHTVAICGGACLLGSLLAGRPGRRGPLAQAEPQAEG
ncbi:protein of unknown function DUF894 DitE [Desulfovibrio sp. X2]|uniref:MFS transporter n=1 Tax=Desulfovibrio sp. X2 TaxID=941449 RepID=UPI000358BFE5|nr:MFS transporter [Desulfovibrio sp. X2]EPR36358.1 protein of unknown function DUF894 DitE [Desulfovibrio sp. X2]